MQRGRAYANLISSGTGGEEGKGKGDVKTVGASWIGSSADECGGRAGKGNQWCQTPFGPYTLECRGVYRAVEDVCIRRTFPGGSVLLPSVCQRWKDRYKDYAKVQTGLPVSGGRTERVRQPAPIQKFLSDKQKTPRRVIV